MQFNYDPKVAKEICAQMGLKWNDSSKSVTVNGEKVESINLKKLFQADPFATNSRVDIPKYMVYDNDYCVKEKNLAAA